MAINKVVYGQNTIIDITDTTAVASDVAQGKYFYTNAGVRTEGTATGGGVVIVDTLDAGGGTVRDITAQSTLLLEGQKEVHLTESPQTVYPTTGYDGFESIVAYSASTTEVTVSSSGVVSQSLQPNTVYHFTSDAITSLTISFAEAGANNQYHFDFISPATAVSLTLPASVTMANSFTVEANTKVEIDIYDNYGIAAEWIYDGGQ